MTSTPLRPTQTTVPEGFHDAIGDADGELKLKTIVLRRRTGGATQATTNLPRKAHISK
jgi:hypothetical protein